MEYLQSASSNVGKGEKFKLNMIMGKKEQNVHLAVQTLKNEAEEISHFLR